MENFNSEFLAVLGDGMNPYRWQHTTGICLECPSHIWTSEAARISYVDFYRAFGFPYGNMTHPHKHITFFELKAVSGCLIQKGYTTNCRFSDRHPESVLFDVNGFLDSVIHYYDDIGYITLYANYTPCNEFDHYCISKMYDFMTRHTDLRLDIYFSQLYRTDDDFPTAVWNRKALRSLAGLWPQVTINPLSGRIWHVVLRRFVKGLPEATLSQPVLPVRASTDRYNAVQIHTITGISPYFDEAASLMNNVRREPWHSSEVRQPMNYGSLLHHAPPMIRSGLPPLVVPGQVALPFNMSLPLGGQQQYASSKPKYVVRHQRMPRPMNELLDGLRTNSNFSSDKSSKR